MKIDTHVHTTCSDGRMTVAEVFRQAAGLGIRLLAITDHDTIGAYPEAFEAAERGGITPVAGVELSTRDEDGHKDVHIVGLRIDTGHGRLRDELRKLAEARVNARRRLLDNMNRYMAERHHRWVPVQFEDVRRRVAGSIVGKPHLAAAMIERARRSGMAIREEELYHLFRLPGIASAKEYELTMAECISLIKSAGGVPVLAHPCEYWQPDAVVSKFSRLGGEAVELCKYRYKIKIHAIRDAQDLPGREEIERRLNEGTIALARRHGLKLTACSDYHGKIGEPGMETDEYGIDIGWLLG